MSIVSYCRRPACTIGSDRTLQAAAGQMGKEGVGFLVVREEGRATGVLSDRDVALHVLADGRDAATTRVNEASRPLIAIDRRDSLEDALARMARTHVRRLPVTDDGRVEGVVSADDLVLLLSREIGGLGDVLLAQLPGGASRPVGHEAPQGRAGRAAEHYAGEVVSASGRASVAELGQLMQERAVGSVVVLDGEGRGAGLVTDRDLALRVVAEGLSPADTIASAVMSAPLLGARAADPLEEVVARMRSAGVRRMPILEDERPVGLVTFDDLLVTLGRELDRLADCVAGEVRRARARSAPARVRHELEERIEEFAGRLRDVGDEALRSLGRELDGVVERVTRAVRSGSARLRSSPLRVDELMQTDVRTCTPEDFLSEPARIMWERDCGCVPVVSADGSGRVVGMITDRDICMAALTGGVPLHQALVKGAMAPRVTACRPEDAVADAGALMRSAQVRRLPVVDAAGRLRGLISLADVAEAAAGLRAPAGSVSASEVGRVLEAICRPRSRVATREGAEGTP